MSVVMQPIHTSEEQCTTSGLNQQLPTPLLTPVSDWINVTSSPRGLAETNCWQYVCD
jgi:hypothetical protein